MRRTMPSGPGAAETWMRSTSVFCRSTASVRSMAEASRRTFTASTACAADAPISRAITIATGLAARRKLTLEPPPQGDCLCGNPPRTPARSELPSYSTLCPFRGFRSLSRRRRRAALCALAADLPVESKGQDDLADMRAGLHAGMRGRRLSKGEGTVDHRPDAAGRQQRQHLGFERLAHGRFILDRARAQRRSGVMQALEHDADEIHVGARRRLERDLHDAALDAGRLVIALDIVAADHVEDNIGALAAGRRFGDRDEVFALIVNGEIGAELARGLAFLR